MPELSSPYLQDLLSGTGTATVELRPPPADRTGVQAMDAWIDMHHEVRRLAKGGAYLFLTDNAVGAAEEENLGHLGANLSAEVAPGQVIPFLTCKHTLEYCLMYAQRAWSQGYRALAVLGGDKQVGPSRCLPHAYLLRGRIRERVPGMALGGWANPHNDPGRQAEYLATDEFCGEFWLSQIVSHHSLGRVEAFLKALEEKGVRWRGGEEDLSKGAGPRLPGVFGVFFYKSANPRTLRLLSEFFPVPGQEITREFQEGVSPEEICARSIRALRAVGIREVYVSNLPPRGTARTLKRIFSLVSG